MDLLCSEFEEILALDPMITASHFPYPQDDNENNNSCDNSSGEKENNRPNGLNILKKSEEQADSISSQTKESRVLDEEPDGEKKATVLEEQKLMERENYENIHTIDSRINELEAKNQRVPEFLQEDPLIAVPAALGNFWAKWKGPAMRSVGTISNSLLSGVQIIHAEIKEMQKNQREAELRMEMEMREKALQRQRERLEKEMIDRINQQAKQCVANEHKEIESEIVIHAVEDTNAAESKKYFNTTTHPIGFKTAQQLLAVSKCSTPPVAPVALFETVAKRQNNCSFSNKKAFMDSKVLKCTVGKSTPVSLVYTDSHNMRGLNQYPSPYSSGEQSNIRENTTRIAQTFFRRKPLVQVSAKDDIIKDKQTSQKGTDEENKQERIIEREFNKEESICVDLKIETADNERSGGDPHDVLENNDDYVEKSEAVPSECPPDVNNESDTEDELIVIKAKIEFSDSTSSELTAKATESCTAVAAAWVFSNWDKIKKSLKADIDEEFAASSLEAFLLNAEEKSDELPVKIIAKWEYVYELGCQILDAN